MILFKKISAAAALLASVSMSATPVYAAETTVRAAAMSQPAGIDYAAWDASSTDVAQHRRYRDRHYRGYRHRDYRNRTSAGDVIAGVAILGGIIAIADAVSKNDRNRNRNVRYDDRDTRNAGLDGAADLCVREVERNTRVQRVDSVDRNASGWRVAGTLYNGESFICRLGQNGRIENIDYGATTRYDNGGFEQSGYRAPVVDRQYSDDRYVTARAERDYPTTDAQPAYPGGPIAGDYEYTEPDTRRGG